MIGYIPEIICVSHNIFKGDSFGIVIQLLVCIQPVYTYIIIH